MLSTLQTKLCVTVLSVLLVAIVNACNAVSSIPGNIAGQLMNDAGQGRGFITVRLVDPASGEVIAADNADDTGNFMFTNIDPGEYIVKTIAVGDKEYRNDSKQFKLSPGKTMQLTIIVYDDFVDEAAPENSAS